MKKIEKNRKESSSKDWNIKKPKVMSKNMIGFIKHPELSDRTDFELLASESKLITGRLYLVLNVGMLSIMKAHSTSSYSSIQSTSIKPYTKPCFVIKDGACDIYVTKPNGVQELFIRDDIGFFNIKKLQP